MNKIFQTDTTNKTGDCHKASVASLFDIPFEEIPNFIEYEDWRKTYYDFLRDRNIGLVIIPILDAECLRMFLKMNPEIRTGCLLAVRSFKHTDKGHCVVGAIVNGEIEITHDPNPENADKKTSDCEASPA